MLLKKGYHINMFEYLGSTIVVAMTINQREPRYNLRYLVFIMIAFLVQTVSGKRLYVFRQTLVRKLTKQLTQNAYSSLRYTN